MIGYIEQIMENLQKFIDQSGLEMVIHGNQLQVPEVHNDTHILAKLFWQLDMGRNKEETREARRIKAWR